MVDASLYADLDITTEKVCKGLAIPPSYWRRNVCLFILKTLKRYKRINLPLHRDNFVDNVLYLEVQDQYPQLFPKNPNPVYEKWARLVVHFGAVRTKQNHSKRKATRSRRARSSEEDDSSADEGQQDTTTKCNEDKQKETPVQSDGGTTHGILPADYHARRLPNMIMLAQRQTVNRTRSALCVSHQLSSMELDQDQRHLTIDDLGWDKFLAWLEKRLDFRAGVDVVLYVSGDEGVALDDEQSWRAALQEMYAEGCRRFSFLVLDRSRSRKSIEN